jgi:hypothetical protein
MFGNTVALNFEFPIVVTVAEIFMEEKLAKF